MDSTNEVAIFTDTSLGTRIALSISPHIAARDFKKQLEVAHLQCFPESKEIEVYGLKVKRKSFMYYLPDSLPIELAFEGVRGAWFLCAEARTSSSVDSETDRIHLFKESDRKGMKFECFSREENRILSAATEVSRGMSSGAKSVTSIINRYFANSIEIDKKTGSASPTGSEVTSKISKSGRRRSSMRLRVKRRASIFLLPTSSDHCGVKIGKRIVTAKNNLGVFLANKKPVLHCRRDSCLVEQSVFEISDSEDSEQSSFCG